jgi:putative oxidoreductase
MCIINDMKKYLTLKNLGWLLTALVTFMLGMSGVSKIVGTEEMIKNFTFMNLLPYLALLGVVELAGVVMLVIPKTAKYGAVLLSSYLSGAVAIHLAMMGGTGVMVPFILGLAVWSAYCLRTHTIK